MLVERIIYCMPYSLVLQDVNNLLQRRRNSQFAGKQFARTALATVVRPVHDREGNEIYSSRTTGLPVDIKLSVHRLKVADSTATNTSRVVNVPITSILKNNRRFGYTFEILTLEQTHVWQMHSLIFSCFNYKTEQTRASVRKTNATEYATGSIYLTHLAILLLANALLHQLSAFSFCQS